MTRKSLKIGRYTEEEIFQYLAGENGSMLGRSMYDAIFDFIHALITENDQLKKDEEYLKRELNKKDKVIKETIDYIKSDNSYLGENDDASDWYLYETGVGQDLLEILERTDK